jgi:hypothetical protein
MELELIREYHAGGTNGEVRHNGVLICRTIELPWLQNRRRVSCIPEGRYEVRARFTARRGQHLVVLPVPGRSGILIHPANHAMTELLGCIAPVTEHTGPGHGTLSRAATQTLYAHVRTAFALNEKVFITIKAKNV